MVTEAMVCFETLMRTEFGITGFELNHVRKTCIVSTVRQLLNRCDNVKGKPNKKLVATILLDYVTDARRHWFLLKHPRFLHMVLDKIAEFMSESAFKNDEPKRWLQRLYVNEALRKHLHVETTKGETFAQIVGDHDEEWPCDCDENGIKHDEAIHEPDRCEACHCDGCGELRSNDFATKQRSRCVCGARYCEACILSSVGFKYERIGIGEVDGMRLIECVRCDKNMLRLAKAYVNGGDKQQYRQLCNTYARLPPWHLAVEYMAHDKTLGPYEESY